jgi:hypothetical protein
MLLLLDRYPIVDDIFIMSLGRRHENTQWSIWINSKGFGMET